MGDAGCAAHQGCELPTCARFCEFLECTAACDHQRDDDGREVFPQRDGTGDGKQCDDIDTEHAAPQCGREVSKDDEPDQESWNDPGQWADYKAGGEAKQYNR
jgi:hypothetical protein